jgi:hypothetical protein
MGYKHAIERTRRATVAEPLQGILAGALLGIMVLLAFAAIGIGVDYSKEFQLESAAKAEAQLAAADGRQDTQIRDAILQKAQALGLPVDPSSIVIHATPPPESDQETGQLMTAIGIKKRTTSTGRVDITVSFDLPYRYPGGVTSIHFRFVVSDRNI